MGTLFFYITLPLLYLISILPFWVLQRLSDIIYFIIYHLIGYRKKVVFENLSNSFPEKKNEELLKIQKRFYRYFCDLILETLKTLTISPKSLRKHVTFQDLEVFEKYKQQNQSIIIVMGHFGNWELGGARFALESYHKLYVIYHPLANKNFDGLVYKMRTRLGNGLYAMKNAIRGMIENKDNLTATAFIADQTPSASGAYWTNFMHQDTPIFTGAGKIAKKLNYPVVYISIDRNKRGYYNVSLEDIVPNPSEYSVEEISEMYTRRLEQDIQRNPEIWLWSHRRWKHKRQKT